MDAAMIRTRIEAVWDELPPIFTVPDVLQLIGKSKEEGSTVRVVLDLLVGEGRLFHSLRLQHRLGRKPTAWTKMCNGTCEEVVLATVRAALPRMPRVFGLKELLAVVGMARMQASVRDALDRLADEAVVVRVRVKDLERKKLGRPKVLCWSADTHVIAQELAMKARIEQGKVAQTEQEEDPDVRLARLLKPWDPFADQ